MIATTKTKNVERTTKEHASSKTVEHPATATRGASTVDGHGIMSTIALQIQSIYKPDPQTIPRPPEDEFYVTEENWRLTIIALINAMPLLVLGPSGTGKTELIYRAVKATRRTLEAFNMGTMTEPRSSLIGVTHFDPSRGTVFQESRFVQKLRQPYTTLLFDELNRAPKEATNMLLPLLDDQKMITLDESETCEVVSPAEGVGFCATANMGCEYTGTNELDWAVMNRFQVVIRMDFMDPSKEISVLCKRYPQIPWLDARQLVMTARRQRELWCDGEYATPISIRSLLAAAKLYTEGIPLTMAFRFCVHNHFSATGGLASDYDKLWELWRFTSAKGLR